MTPERHIPESRIALNPVVIDDSKRGGAIHEGEHYVISSDQIREIDNILSNDRSCSIADIIGELPPFLNNLESKQHRCPIDEHALVEWLKEQELEAHNTWCDDCEFLNDCQIQEDELKGDILCAKDVQDKAYRKVIDKIQNGRVRQMHRRER